MIFLTPEIVENPAGLDVITQEIQESATGAHNAVAPGALQVHLDRLKAARARVEQEAQAEQPVPVPDADATDPYELSP